MILKRSFVFRGGIVGRVGRQRTDGGGRGLEQLGQLLVTLQEARK